MSSLTKDRVPKEEPEALSPCNVTSAPSLLITMINLRDPWRQPMTPTWVSQPFLQACGKAARPAGPQCLCPSHSHLLSKRCKQSDPRHLMFLPLHRRGTQWLIPNLLQLFLCSLCGYTAEHVKMKPTFTRYHLLNFCYIIRDICNST